MLYVFTKFFNPLFSSFFSPRTVECDLYVDNYHPKHLTVFSELFSIKEVSHSVRDYMPNCETDYSPFVVRQREVCKNFWHNFVNKIHLVRSGWISARCCRSWTFSWIHHWACCPLGVMVVIIIVMMRITIILC